jgi:hypothetical protein
MEVLECCIDEQTREGMGPPREKERRLAELGWRCTVVPCIRNCPPPIGTPSRTLGIGLQEGPRGGVFFCARYP